MQPTMSTSLSPQQESLTAKDKILAHVYYTCAQHGTWPFPMPEELAAYHRKRDELTIQCLLGEACYCATEVTLKIARRTTHGPNRCL